MKVLFIGGTGNISMSCSKKAIDENIDLYILNRGKSSNIPKGAHSIICDINNKDEVKYLVKDHRFDVVVNWIAFDVPDIKRDFEIFKDKTAQYIFISSASCYQKPLEYPIITENTPLSNPFWDYARKKIACENLLQELYHNNNFPITIVRPSHTYENVIPVAIGGWNNYTIIDRIKKGKKIIIHGDGSSLWTITHAKDFAKGFVGLLGQKQAIGESYHITSDEILTWNQIYGAVADAAGKEANVVYIPSDYIGRFDEHVKGSLLGDKSVSVIFDNSKIKKLVPDFEANILFKEGIKRTVDWFEQDNKRMQFTDEKNQFMDKVIQMYERNA